MKLSWHSSFLAVAFLTACSGSHNAGLPPTETMRSHEANVASTSTACVLVSSTLGIPSAGSLTLAATSATDAWSFGEKNPPFVNALPVDHFDGVAWTASPFPAIPSPFASINSAYAIAPNDVWAVGAAGVPTSGPSVQLIFHWNGSAWSAVTHPKWPFFVPDVVYADAPNDVWIAGTRIFSRVFLAHWDGTSWTLRNWIYDVDDASGLAVFGPNSVTVSFIAVFLGESETNAFVLRWDGTTIHKELLPPLNGVFPLEVTGFGGTSPTDLWAVGNNSNRASYIAHRHFTWSPFIVSVDAQSMEPVSVAPFRSTYAVAETFSQSTSNGGLLVYNGVNRWRLTANPFPAGTSPSARIVVLKNTTSFWSVIVSPNGASNTPVLIQCPANPPPPV